MVSNVRLKVFLQDYVFGFLSRINKHKSHRQDRIMLYSNLGFRDNIKALFDYLIEKGYNSKYNIICSLNDYADYKDLKIHNVSFVSNIKGVLSYFSTGYVYYCFGKIPLIPAKDQKVIQMWHGCPFKAPDEGMLKGHSWDKQYYTNVLSTSRHFTAFWSYAFSIPESNIIICGQPRCDDLYKPSPEYDFGQYKKLILWTPTFRKSKVTGYSDIRQQDEIVPVLKANDFEFINSQLKEIGVKIIVKLHPMQDLDKYNLVNLDNFILMSHQEFTRREMSLYRLMKQCDALITDYSSIFFDYLLLNRPIGFTEDDCEDYGSTRGFALEDPDSYKAGFRIKTKEDLLRFAKDLSDGKDEYRQERVRVLDLSNDYRDGQFSKCALESVGIKL